MIRYLILQGIDPGRMTAKGYGESMLLNDCKDGVVCTEEEHQMNRRTEFKVTGTYSSGRMSPFDKYQEGDVIPKDRFGSGFFKACKK